MERHVRLLLRVIFLIDRIDQDLDTNSDHWLSWCHNGLSQCWQDSWWHDATILSVDHWPVPARCLQKTQQFMDPLQSEREILELKFLPLYRIFNKGWFIYNLFIYNIKIRGATTKISKGTLVSFFGHFGHICMLLEFDNLKTWRSCGIQDHQTLEAYICAQNDQRSSPKCPWRF